MKIIKFLLIIFCLVCFYACSTRVSLLPPPLKRKPAQVSQKTEYSKIQFVKYSIQVGAFQSFSNADAYSLKLDKYVDAFSFKDKDGLFKVRFGNYSSKQSAHKNAQQLKDMNVIDEYFLVLPEKYENKYIQTSQIRERIINTASKYIGVPYSWGGEDSVTGFDCSGLTSSVYRESGVMLPRTSRQQYKTGMFVLKKDLQQGDLIFFKTRGKAVSHVGIYTGNSRFVHAPGKGQTVCFQSLNASYYKNNYAGARTYFN
ncbi:MAG: C40 family peptidase [Desulfobacteraceae bacterium]|nr:C40 family peptidase [Desulfobacteraceae bacterium]